jgi:GNAT superfamily N-acetyltransferase
MVDRKPQFSLREAVTEDLQRCIALDHSGSSDYVWQLDVGDDPIGMQYQFRQVRLPRPMTITFPQDARLMLASWEHRGFFVVAEEQDKLLGYIHMELDRGCSIGWVRQLVVDRSVRRRRVGTALYRAGHAWARTKGLARITVETQTKNYPGIAFCQRLGLRFCGFNDRYYPNQDIAVFFTQSVR